MLALSGLLLVVAGAIDAAGATGASGARGATGATGASGAADPAPRAQLRGFACQRALDPSNRSISVTAVMRPLTGTRHLALKFDLLYTPGEGPPDTFLRAGDLGRWIAPANASLGQLPGDVWNLHKQVVNLPAPATYRFRVVFRWTGTGGRELGQMVLDSRRCHQPELRPDLLVTSIAVSAVQGQPGSDLYTAVIANQGNSGAGPFEVLFAPADGSTPKTHTVSFLPAHSEETETFVGPQCTAATDPTITADAASQVDDLNRANNSLTATCPP